MFFQSSIFMKILMMMNFYMIDPFNIIALKHTNIYEKTEYERN